MAGIFGLLMSGAGVIKDQYFNLTSLLLPGNGTNGAQNNTFLDSGTANSGSGFTITRNGNTTQGTFSPFSQTGWGNYFDGSGDYLSLASDAALAPQASDFTIEAWLYPTAALSTYNSIYETSVTDGLLFGKVTSGYGIRQVGVADLISATAPAINQWVHVAASRSGTTLRLFINGVLSATVTNSTNFPAGTVTLGAGNAGANPFTGYVSNFRFVKGTAVYTATFTPPTQPLTAITNTSLLTCQSNRFVDNSATPKTITVNGNTSVTPFSPFAPTSSYSAAAVGGSGYFDGSGDYLSAPSNAAFSFSTSSFTVEAWVYLTAATNNSTIASNASYSGADGDWIVRVGGAGGAAGKWEFVTFFGGTAYQAIANSAVTTNAWTHIAAVKSGNTMTIYVNGTAQTTTASNANSVGFSNQSTLIASSNGFGNFPGYISNLRIVKGTAVVPPSGGPTSPVAEVSGTSLLLNFTNAGVVDATAKNVLETVNNAQISTSVKQFGTGSMYFPQSGTTDYLLTPTSNNYVFGTGDFTIEGWIYITSTGTVRHFYDQRPASTDGAYPTLRMNASNAMEYVTGGSIVITSSALSQSVWHHFALARSGTSTRLFVNGAQVGSTYTDSTNYLCGANRPLIGGSGYHLTTFAFPGYIDDLRVTRGVARYTSNFTAPTAPFPLQ